MSGFARRIQRTVHTSIAPPISGLAGGPGGPILILQSASNPFSDYYAEILRTEGLNSFASRAIETITAGALSPYSVIILGSFTLSTQQVTLLTNWVHAGGNLIAMRPDKKLADLAGVSDASGTQSEGYILIDTSRAPGHGIVGQTIQYHGPADQYTTSVGTRSIATLYSSANSATVYPAATYREVGANGGKVSIFAFDMARSLVLSHQGNPDWAGDERDGLLPIRPDDLFYGAKAGDVQPDYIDMSKVAIPQADELQRFLTNTIQHMHSDRNPIPKFWYFPKNKKAVLVMTGDDHATSNGTQASFDYMLSHSPSGSTVEDWSALRATSWMYTNTPLSNAQAAGYYAQGFDMGVHVSTGANNFTLQSLDETFATDLSAFQARYTSLPPQQGSRTHAIVWSDYFSTPTIEHKYGIRMDLNYYYWPNAFVLNRPGFFTGSGLSMRFADVDGTMIDVYQTPSHLVNESGMTFPAAIHTQIERALGPEGYYGALGTHYDYSDNFDRQLIDAALAYDIPAVSAQQMQDWNDGRNASHFSAAQWSGNVLQFTAATDVKVGTMLRGMLPMRSSQGVLSAMTINGSSLSFDTEAVKGIQYAMFAVSAGSYTATYDPDLTAPTVLSVMPANSAVGVNPVTGTISIDFSEQIDSSSITSSTIELRNAGNTLIPTTLTLTEKDAGSSVAIMPTTQLAENTTYTITVRGGAAPHIKDVVGNALASSYSWTFTTGVNQFSLWYPTVPSPVSTETTDSSQVQLGVRFSSDVNGSITSVGFYKTSNDMSQHTVRVWDANGVSIGTGVTANETATGWQMATLSSPVPITAGLTYTASYTAPVGQYSHTDAYMTNGYTNGALHVPNNGGVYSYDASMPSQSFGSNNYWVDFIFRPS